jgi:uncharacterized OB-fold protein
MGASPERRSRVRPAPVITDDNSAFWAAARDHVLAIQRCSSCHAFHHPPRPMCPVCHTLDLEATPVAGTGVVYSYSLLHHPQNDAFDYPVIAVLVELDEGVRVLSNLVGVEVADIAIGIPVQVCFLPVSDGMSIPVFEPRGATS